LQNKRKNTAGGGFGSNLVQSEKVIRRKHLLAGQLKIAVFDT